MYVGTSFARPRFFYTQASYCLPRFLFMMKMSFVAQIPSFELLLLISISRLAISVLLLDILNLCTEQNRGRLRWCGTSAAL